MIIQSSGQSLQSFTGRTSFTALRIGLVRQLYYFIQLAPRDEEQKSRR
jgi:hypothetical protein